MTEKPPVPSCLHTEGAELERRREQFERLVPRRTPELTDKVVKAIFEVMLAGPPSMMRARICAGIIVDLVFGKKEE